MKKSKKSSRKGQPLERPHYMQPMELSTPEAVEVWRRMTDPAFRGASLRAFDILMRRDWWTRKFRNGWAICSAVHGELDTSPHLVATAGEGGGE